MSPAFRLFCPVLFSSCFGFCCNFAVYVNFTDNVFYRDGFGGACVNGTAAHQAAEVGGILNQVRDQNQYAEDDGNNGGQLGQLLIQRGTLGLAEEGFCTAGDGTGQVVGLTVLHQNSYDQENGGNNENDTDCDLHNSLRDPPETSLPGSVVEVLDIEWA